MSGEVEDVAHGRGAERIDRLRVVADHGEAAPVGLERQQDRRLQPVGVLIFVDQDMIEARADLGGELALGQHVREIEQQVVVIEHVLALLRLDVSGEQLLQLGRPVGAPRKRPAQHLLERRLAVHRARIDRQARALGRETVLGARQIELVAHQVHQVGRVLAVVDGERAVEPDALGIFAQQPRADGVERAGPGEPGGRVGAARRGSRMRSARRSISAAARREKVSSRMRCGSAPFITRCATRCASVSVLPEPAPAMISSAR